ncbi:MAG: DUF6600 domain-containing protein [Terriglobales bacterium]
MSLGMRAVRWAGVAVALLAWAGWAWAAAAPGVARISLVSGQASLLRSGAASWDQALLNTPLVAGDEVYTAPGARMEVEFDYAHRAWLAGGSDLVISAFAGQNLQLQLKSGTLSFATLPGGNLQTEIDLPNAGVRPQGSGQWRVDVVDAAHASVTADDGSVQVFTPQGAVEAQAGQQVQLAGSQGNAQYRTVSAPAQDAWDQWVAAREQRVEQAADYRDQYVSTSVSGAEDLDTYGHWEYVSGYGQCWTPYAAGFQPYFDGQWAWTPYYGWSWVSYEPWGWAPFHYGRWFWQSAIGWAWWPGGFAGPAIWAPAYVSFFVGGPAWGVGFAHPAIGWVALAPGERYIGYSQTRWLRRGAPVTAIYRPGVNAPMVRPAGLLNAHAPGGVIAIPQGSFAGGAVNRLGRTVAVGHIQRAAAVNGTAPVAPTAGRSGFGRATVAAPRTITARTVFRRGPAAAMPPRVGMAAVGRQIEATRTRAGMAAMPEQSAPRAARPAAAAGDFRGFGAAARQAPAGRAEGGFENHPLGNATPERTYGRTNQAAPQGNGDRRAAPAERQEPNRAAPARQAKPERQAAPRKAAPDNKTRPPAKRHDGNNPGRRAASGGNRGGGGHGGGGHRHAR